MQTPWGLPIHYEMKWWAHGGETESSSLSRTCTSVLCWWKGPPAWAAHPTEWQRQNPGCLWGPHLPSKCPCAWRSRILDRWLKVSWWVKKDHGKKEMLLPFRTLITPFSWFLNKQPMFSLCTVPHKLCSWPCHPSWFLAYLPSSFPDIAFSPFLRWWNPSPSSHLPMTPSQLSQWSTLEWNKALSDPVHSFSISMCELPWHVS